MKRFQSVIAATAIAAFALTSCQKADPVTPAPEREKTVPEKVEGELLEIASNDWLSLLDTLEYFDTNFIQQGKYKGYGPDNVYYEMSMNPSLSEGLKIKFTVQDSVFFTAAGKISPMSLTVNVFNTDFSVKQEQADSASVNIGKNITVITPYSFVFGADTQAPLLYEGKRVGYLDRETFENEDYTTSSHLVMHYYNDTRTFAFYGN